MTTKIMTVHTSQPINLIELLRCNIKIHSMLAQETKKGSLTIHADNTLVL